MIAISDSWPFNHPASLAVPRTAVEKCISAFLIVRYLWFEVIYIMPYISKHLHSLKASLYFQSPSGHLLTSFIQQAGTSTFLTAISQVQMSLLHSCETLLSYPVM